MGRLCCRLCRTELAEDKTSVTRHINTAKHVNAAEKAAKQTVDEQARARVLSEYFAQSNAKGASLTDAQQLFRVEILRAQLISAIPLAKLDEPMRGVLERGGHSLTSATHMAQLLPFVLQEEMALIKEEIARSQLSVTFDGTTRGAEVLAVVLRFVDEHMTIQQRLVHMGHYARAFDNRQLAGALVTLLMTTLAVKQDNVIQFQIDRSETGLVAVDTLQNIYHSASAGACLAHTLDHCGEHVLLPTAQTFCSSLSALMSKSLVAKQLWLTVTGTMLRSKSKTRWWSEFEVLMQVLAAEQQWEAASKGSAIETFLEKAAAKVNKNNTITKSLVPKWQIKANRRAILFELVCLQAAAKPFVQATYLLEGDGPLAMITYDVIRGLETVVTLDVGVSPVTVTVGSYALFVVGCLAQTRAAAPEYT
eukprot:TRINITY_DN4396_c0_g1_i1.p1 TRINITY_DN4396_c0_g1~~TRINITY_DN4396_c0_g1_i1.p1  ORF type:complete len:421 (+),score=100.00 TRINITY_DN4396_c0_g1_i1:497-1759(+)